MKGDEMAEEYRSADLQSAIAELHSAEASECSRREFIARLPITNRRYSRLQICATKIERLNLDQHPRRVLDGFLDAFEKHHSFAAIHDTMMVAQRDVHHGPADDVAIASDRPLLYGVESQEADRRRKG